MATVCSNITKHKKRTENWPLFAYTHYKALETNNSCNSLQYYKLLQKTINFKNITNSYCDK